MRQWLAFSAAPHAGDRAPDVGLGERRLHDLLRGTHHTLLLFDGAAPTPAGYRTLLRAAAEVEAAWGGRVRPRLVVPRAEAPPELAESATWTLLDPDGALHARYGAGAECLYLIRPDGYVGYRAQPIDVDRLRAELARRFR